MTVSYLPLLGDALDSPPNKTDLVMRNIIVDPVPEITSVMVDRSMMNFRTIMYVIWYEYNVCYMVGV